MISIATLRPVVEAWASEFDSPEAAYRALSVATGLASDTWRKRFADDPLRGWWRLGAIDEADVDEFLAAAGLTHLWGELAGRSDVGLHCEDCGCAITLESGYRPLDLFRPDSSSQQDVVWDATKQKLVVRPGAARSGGRRFRKIDLCRRCAAEALRLRASKNPKIGHKGRLGTLSTRDRVAPRRGGRPRLLDEAELRSAYTIYKQQGLSIGELARRLAATRDKGTYSGYYQSILYGWRKLGLALRPKGEQIGLSVHGTDGTKSKHHAVRCRERLSGGRRCTQFVRRVVTETGSAPAADGFCWNHGVGSRAARRRRDEERIA